MKVRGRRIPIVAGLPLLAACWALLWSVDTFWNPLFFMGTWSGATLVMYALGKDGYPGLRRHAFLSALSIPFWWWFEIVNGWVGNWEYLGAVRYRNWEYLLMGSVAFSTVIPAVDAATRLTTGWLPEQAPGQARMHRGWYTAQAGLGLLLHVAVYLWPTIFFPFVWVAPFLMADALVGYSGGRSLVDAMVRGKWRLTLAVGLAGLTCGFLWEFWNFWSVPQWIYHVPHFDFGHVFEMPLLGYGGYVPFAWTVYQLLQLTAVWTDRAINQLPVSSDARA
ncbi:MAG: hypothetical protein HYX93_02560 [Chloroflexi bacterium]|nr:hypothetical protein [Chloroflexota bacterium]